jgi:hypothetical protein
MRPSVGLYHVIQLDVTTSTTASNRSAYCPRVVTVDVDWFSRLENQFGVIITVRQIGEKYAKFRGFAIEGVAQ